MIYTVTLNPAIDKTVIIDGFAINKVNRISSVQLDPGGKGINVSKMVKNLQGKSIAIMISGGYNGQKLIEMLDEADIVFKSMPCKGETRVNVKIVDSKNGTFTDINEKGPTVTTKNLEAIHNYLEEKLNENDILVLAGSIPQGVPIDIYKTWSDVARSKGAKVILDADSEALSKGIEGKPFMIKPNQDELERYFGISFVDDSAMVGYAKRLIEKGLEYIVVSQGSKGCMLISKESAIKLAPINVQVRSTVGAGDSMVGAIATGLEEAFENKTEINFDTMRSIVAYGVAASSASIEKEGTIMGTRKRMNELHEGMARVSEG